MLFLSPTEKKHSLSKSNIVTINFSYCYFYYYKIGILFESFPFFSLPSVVLFLDNVRFPKDDATLYSQMNNYTMYAFIHVYKFGSGDNFKARRIIKEKLKSVIKGKKVKV